MLVIKFLYHLVSTGIPVLVSISMDLVVCIDQTGTFTADPWTLSYEFTKSLGGATCYCQNSKGLRRF